MSSTELTRVTGALARALSIDDVDQIGRDTGQSERLRTITPSRLFLSLLVALGSGTIESLADLLREFNHQNDVAVAYKAFYNRLARSSFVTFMRQMFARLVEHLSIQTLTPAGRTALARFKDIVIQDGSSFAVKHKLRGVFPGRFTTKAPAAVELHVTFSGFSDEASVVELAPDTKAERDFLPKPLALKDKLLLADRGYPSVGYFSEVRAEGGSFVVRLTSSYNPWVRAAWIEGKRVDLAEPVRLSRFIAQQPGRHMDLDVEYANLHKFDTANEYIAAGLIWASLCAAILKRFLAHAAQRVGGKPISTRRVAMCAGHIMDELVAALLASVSIAAAVRDGLAFLLANAQRSNPKRDRKTGRLRSGLLVVGERS